LRGPRSRRSAAVLLLATGAFVLGSSSNANAHPLGNATVNHYDGLALFADKVVDHAVEDVAEIPTFQRKTRIDTNSDGTLSAGESSAYAATQCSDMARGVTIKVEGVRIPLIVDSSGYSERAGAVGLTIGRLECELSGRASLAGAATVEVSNRWDDDGVGWHEITAVSTGLSLSNSPFPAKSISNELRTYPNNLLSSPLNVRGGTLKTAPGGSSTYEAAKNLPVAGVAVRALDHLSRAFNNEVGAKHLTVGVGLLGLLLALALGAGHAFLPGHGKTIMAAYLVGRRGSLRDVVTVGATVTITHTAGVLLLGLAITTSTAFAPGAVEKYLGVASGGIVALVGLGLLVTALKRRRSPMLVLDALLDPVTVGAGAPESHLHSHEHPHPHEHHPAHAHASGHSHSHAGKGHTHGPQERFGRGGLVGLGVAGGLVPSPSALLVLLAATALGRTWFGITLVLGYGIGMAVALSVAGLLLVRLRGRIDRWTSGTRLARANKLAATLPILTALLVLTVGTGLALRALGGTV
jgi:nickel/cobalt exporter